MDGYRAMLGLSHLKDYVANIKPKREAYKCGLRFAAAATQLLTLRLMRCKLTADGCDVKSQKVFLEQTDEALKTYRWQFF